MVLPFQSARVLVVGDVMLDRYLEGEVQRISPEAPVPVARIRSQRSVLGGAANVAANVTGLGAQCYLVGYLGVDSHQTELKDLLDQAHIQWMGVPSVKPTITKVRVLGGRQQMIRLDYEEPGAYLESEEAQMLGQIQRVLPQCKAVVVSDYGKGACSALVCQSVIQMASKLGVPVLVDPKTTDWSRYTGASLVTPNLKEYSEVVGSHLPNDDTALSEPWESLRARLGLTQMLVTRSEKGMTLLGGAQPLHIHTEAREVFDVSGAGDTVIATLATAWAMGHSLEQAVHLANAAAGVVVGKAGTVPIQWLELQAFMRSRAGLETKVLAASELALIVAAEQAKGRCVVFTNGCFDLLHRGHLSYLRAAKALGHRLVVGLNSDSSVRALKGPERPVNNEQDRAFMLAALEFIDYVVVFEEQTPERLLSELRPDILVKGGDYTPESVLGREYVREVRILPFVDGYSSTQTIQKINKTQ